MIKQIIKEHLIRAREEAYRKELREKEDSYSNWYRWHKAELQRRMNAQDHSEGAALTTTCVRYSHLRSFVLSGGKMPDIIIACDDDGTLTDYAQTLICDFFAANPDIDLVYGDEDRVDEAGQLQDPWLKSDWAPDTFLSTFYFGNVFAFRSSVLFMINPGTRVASDYEARSRLLEDAREEKTGRGGELDDDIKSWIYGTLCLKIAQADGGFTRRNSDRFPIGHIGEILFHASEKKAPWDSRLIRDSLTGRYSSESASTRLISVIIPSKDNPEILFRCIKTMEECTRATPYEIIVVDNGSSEENQRRIRKTIDVHNESGEKGSARYIYEPMEFNFSRMCNIGAQEANGELLLFLNDDIEIAKPGWLSYLSEKAKLPYVGAVGMKLLYPNSDIIQHAGVVNVRVGPIHKLQYCSNREEHYFGFNKGVRNVIAVTGACLMIRASLFNEIGGFDEEHFAVSFNDIDLCLKVYEKGYYNVVRNNMYLYHHESLSRGDDRKDEVKAQRLSREQEALLKLHPAMFRRDPFYHEYLEQDPAVTEFKIAVEDVQLRDPHYVTPQLRTKPVPAKWEDPVLRIGVEFANSLDRWLSGPLTDLPGQDKLHDGYYIKGYSFVINANNAVYERKLLLKKIGDAENTEAAAEASGAQAQDKIWTVDVDNVYRPDIAHNLTNQQNDMLTGFSAVIGEKSLEPGQYLIGMLASDKTGRGRIVNWSDVKLVVR